MAGSVATEWPRRIYWELTRACNLRCVHCRAVPTEFPVPGELSTRSCKKIIDQIASVCRPAVVLTGGEPLLRRDIFDLGRYGESRGLAMGLATNGTLVTRDVAEAIRDAGFRRVSVSLDGPDAESHDRFRQMEGAFRSALFGLENLKASGLYVQINSSITVHNAQRLEDMRHLMARLGIEAWHLFLLVPVGCGLKIAESMQVNGREYERILNWIEDRSADSPFEMRAICAPHFTRIRAQRRMATKADGDGSPDRRPIGKACTAGTAMCFISYRGEMFPCGYLPIKAGDLNRKTFSQIWTTSELLETLRDPDLLGGKCGVCEFRAICSGCRARAYGMTGDYLAEEPFCVHEPAHPR